MKLKNILIVVKDIEKSKQFCLAIMELFSSFNRSGMTIVMVTHSPDVAAYASRQIHICDGKIIESFLGGTYYSSPIK